jgi:hypothetical protein
MIVNRLFGLLSVKAALVVIKTAEIYFYFHHSKGSLLNRQQLKQKIFTHAELSIFLDPTYL